MRKVCGIVVSGKVYHQVVNKVTERGQFLTDVQLFLLSSLCSTDSGFTESFNHVKPN